MDEHTSEKSIKKRKSSIEPGASSSSGCSRKRNATLEEVLLMKTQPKNKILSQSSVDALVAKFVIDGVHPLSIVDEPGFIQLINGEFHQFSLKF